jgi:hypothetical protein
VILGQRRVAWGYLWLALFILTALMGVWAAYDQRAAWMRFALIALGALTAALIGWFARRHEEGTLAAVAVAAGLLAAAVGLYFILTHDWTAPQAEKFAAVQRIGLWIQAQRPALSLTEDINGNVAGGILAVTLPLGAGGLWWAWARRRWLAAAVLAAALAVGLFCLILTASRGAWVGIAAAALAAGAVSRLSHGRLWSRRMTDWAAAGVCVALAGFFWAAVSLPALTHLLGSAEVTGGAVTTSGIAIGRAALWRDMLALVADYPFTGSGLGSTGMVYSSYVMLLHVGFIGHAHNIFLQTAIEQGLIGLLALVGMLVWSFRRLLNDLLGESDARAATLNRSTTWPLYLAALASLTALCSHGMWDAGLYVGKGVPALFLPIGMALALSGRLSPEAQPTIGRAIWPAVAAGVVALIVVLWPDTHAVWIANLAAVRQDRAELGVYHWPDWPLQDAVRRAPEVNLMPAITGYAAALALDPDNVAANRRLGQIALARGEDVDATTYLEAAYRIAPEQRATGQLLGECYALRGDVLSAAVLWQTLDLGQGQITLRRWWREHLGDQQGARWIEQAGQAAGLAATR